MLDCDMMIPQVKVLSRLFVLDEGVFYRQVGRRNSNSCRPRQIFRRRSWSKLAASPTAPVRSWLHRPTRWAILQT